VGVANEDLPDNDDPSNIEVDAPEQPHRSEGTVMAKSKVKPGWVGPLKQAKDGKQPYYCEYGDWSTGDKLRHKCGAAGKKKDAEAEWIKFRQSMESKTHTPNSTRTFGDALDEYEAWIEQRWRLKQNMSGAGIDNYLRAIKLYIRPALGHRRLTDVDSHVVQDLLNDLASNHVTRHILCHTVIKEVFKRAVFLDHLAISPWNRKPWKPPPLPKPATSIPTIEEGRALWHDIQTFPYRGQTNAHINRIAAIALAMFGGCERGVVAALMWEDIDWFAAVINISRSWSPTRDGLKSTKNKFRIRTIPMSQEIRGALTAVWERDGSPSTGFVFNTRDSNSRAAVYAAISANYCYKAMRNAGYVDEKGRPRWSYHELRHYAGSVWLESGEASLSDVSRMLGHGKTETTEKHYIHYFKKQEAQRHRLIADKVSAMHRLPGNTMALPAPMREKCEIDAEAIDITDTS
jgi:integrase